MLSEEKKPKYTHDHLSLIKMSLRTSSATYAGIQQIMISENSTFNLFLTFTEVL
jgi:hypothetical protein